MIDTYNHSACCARNRTTSSRQRDESAELGKSRILTPTHGLDVRKNFSAPSSRGRRVFLDIPSYRTAFIRHADYFDWFVTRPPRWPAPSIVVRKRRQLLVSLSALSEARF